MMIKKFRIFESSALWDDFINKVNTGVIPKDSPDTKNIDKLFMPFFYWLLHADMHCIVLTPSTT